MDVTNAPPLYQLDTNIAGYIVNGRSAAAREMLKRAVADATVTISAITEAEILFGLELRPQATRLRASVDAFLQAVEIRAWDSSAAQAYARLRAALSRTGRSLSEMDLLIAAHALADGAALVSHDQAFQQLNPFLTIVDWATDL